VGDVVDFHQYDEDLNAQIQQAYIEGLSATQVQLAGEGGWTYEIDFAKMVQRNPKTGMERQLRCVTKSVAKADTSGGSAAVSHLKKGDLVDIWIHAAKKWYTDGLIVEVRGETSATGDGKPLPAGCAKITYDNGQKVKWLQPEVLANKLVVKPFVKPPKFHGLMLKQTHGLMASQWNLRHFDLSDGFLSWWKSKADYDAGGKPSVCLILVGLRMQKCGGKSTQFWMRTASSKGVVYLFDINADDADGGLLGLSCLKNKTSEEYADALRQYMFVFNQHGAYAERIHKMSGK
jgi:hypothetical protein